MDWVSRPVRVPIRKRLAVSQLARGDLTKNVAPEVGLGRNKARFSTRTIAGTHASLTSSTVTKRAATRTIYTHQRSTEPGERRKSTPLSSELWHHATCPVNRKPLWLNP